MLAPKKHLFLNFTTVNTGKSHLFFMNKNTTPKMQVWAAIVAASSIPFYFPNFKAHH
jgi:predicted acylesterase/phospholipase RssA